MLSQTAGGTRQLADVPPRGSLDSVHGHHRLVQIEDDAVHHGRFQIPSHCDHCPRAGGVRAVDSSLRGRTGSNPAKRLSSSAREKK